MAALTPRSRHALALPLAGMLAIGATLAIGFVLPDAPQRLGVPLPPLLSPYDPRLSPWALPAGVVLVLGVLAARPLRDSRRLGTVGTLGALWALALALRLACAAARQGPHGWVAVFDDSFEADNEYLPGLTALRYGAAFFVDHFAELVPALPVHVAGHPPGLLLTVHALGLDTPTGLSALLLTVGALTAPLGYALGRTLLGDEARARTAGLLVALSPASLLFGATSADALYATLGTATAAALVAQRRALVALGPALLALASFFSWALLAVGAWSVLVVLRRDGLRRALGLGLACGLVGLAGYAALYAATGFDPLGTLHATGEVYRAGIAAQRPYLYWLIGSPAAFGVALGLPVTWLALRAVARRQGAALALAAVVVLSTLGGFTKAETERIWLFYVPLACVAAAGVLPPRRLTLVAGLLVAQALGLEGLLNTVW